MVVDSPITYTIPVVGSCDILPVSLIRRAWHRSACSSCVLFNYRPPLVQRITNYQTKRSKVRAHPLAFYLGVPGLFRQSVHILDIVHCQEYVPIKQKKTAIYAVINRHIFLSSNIDRLIQLACPDNAMYSSVIVLCRA